MPKPGIWQLQINVISGLMLASGISCLIFALLFFVFYQRIKRKGYENLRQYLIYSLLSLNNFIFLLTFSILINSANNLTLLDTVNRITIITAMFNVVLALHFFVEFFQAKPKLKLKYFYLCNTLFSSCFLFSNSLFLKKEFFQTSRYYTGLSFGLGFRIWGIYLIVLAFYTFISLVSFFKQKQHLSRIYEKSRRAIFFVVISNLIWIITGIIDTLTGMQILDIHPVTWIGSFLVTFSIAGLLISRIETLYEEKRSLYDEVIHDFLTGIYSRSFFEVQTGEVLNSLKREEKKVHIVLFDVDNFKNINDNYGHLCGDFVLQTVSAIVKKTIRPTDIFARFGGDEFAIIFNNNKNHKQALAIVNRIRERINSYRFQFAEKPFSATCSFGVLEIDENAAQNNLTKSEILTLVDQALYDAKNKGKNNISLIVVPEYQKNTGNR